MNEDLEQQKREENEDRRQVRDQELAKILAMGKGERESIIRKCVDRENENMRRGRVGMGDVQVLAFETEYPENLELKGDFGQHGMAAEVVKNKILERDGIKAERGVMTRIWQGIIHQFPEFKSKIIRMIVDPDVHGEKEKYIENLKRVWQFFKDRYPDWIMLDLHGNPFEEYLRQSEEK